MGISSSLFQEKYMIPVGTMVNGKTGAADYMRKIAPLGFECCQIFFGDNAMTINDFPALAGDIRETARACGMSVSCLGIYGNPLENDDAAHAARKSWELCIDHAVDFGCDLVCGFAGRLTDKPIPESIPRFKSVFGDLAARAKERKVRLAFENCPMGGDWKRGSWNIAINPAAWELMFAALPDANLGLEWEPAHQLLQFIAPIPQLREWAPKVFHVHGKDGNINHDLLARYGTRSDRTFFHPRVPGFGDSDWRQIITILQMCKYQGAIDIEGWHDPVYRDDLEMTGQVQALRYMKQCRGGEFITNP